MKFRIEDLEKYKKELEKTGIKSIKFENNIVFFNLGILGYVLTTVENRKLKKLAQSKDWLTYKNQVWEVLCGEYV